MSDRVVYQASYSSCGVRRYIGTNHTACFIHVKARARARAHTSLLAFSLSFSLRLSCTSSPPMVVGAVSLPWMRPGSPPRIAPDPAPHLMWLRLYK
jgi:hypothetical protein